MGARSIVSRVALALGVLSGSGASATQHVEETTPESLYQQSVEACVAGDDAGRRKALKAALAIDPDFEPARAEFGYVRLDGDWVLAEVAQAAAELDPRRSEYARLRASANDTLADHERLARWCENKGLLFEARPHWLRVLEAKPKDRAALSSLRAVWRGGQLVDREVASAAESAEKEHQRAAKEWDRRLRRVERPEASDEQLDLLRDDFDRHAIDPVESRIASLLEPGDTKTRSKRRDIAVAFIDAAETMDDVAVTASLCRIATRAPTDELRRIASRAVVYRPKSEAAPLLLATFVAPIESDYEVSWDSSGDVTYEHRLLAGGEEVDRAWTRRRVARIGAQRIAQQTSVDEMLRATYRARLIAVERTIDFEVEARETERRVEEYNRVAALNNERVVEVLQQVTGESLGSEPRPWWDYWQQYTGYDTPYERPLYEYEESYEIEDYCAPPPPRPRCECFEAGTLVWTRDGLVPIESVERGDLVLCRDPHRGGLAYRVVVQTTRREPSPMVEVRTGGETIRATVGHPFWVVGQGWKMAKELSTGDTLSCVSGPRRVESAAPLADREAFNLVVEGAANYYVGEAGVLVHDNTPRRPAAGLVARR